MESEDTYRSVKSLNLFLDGGGEDRLRVRVRLGATRECGSRGCLNATGVVLGLAVDAKEVQQLGFFRRSLVLFGREGTSVPQNLECRDWRRG